MNQSKQEWRAAMSEAVATVVSTATAAIRVAEANVRRARRYQEARAAPAKDGTGIGEGCEATRQRESAASDSYG